MLKHAQTACLVSCVAISSVFASHSVTLAQSVGGHGEHHHLIIGIDGLETLNSGIYSGLPNPNYQRISLLFPHQHQPVEISHFHALGIYSYTGAADNPTILSTSTNNQLPETRFNLPPIPLFPGSGVFAGQKISQKTDSHIYSDLKIRPVAHLTEDISNPYVNAIYNTGNGRWNSLLGDEATIALQLVSITPGLNVANSEGVNLFNAVDDTYTIGNGDYFSFTPVFSVDNNAPLATYSATFRFLDVNTNNNRIPLQSSGTFTLNFQQATIPESSSVLGIGIFGAIAFLTRRRQQY